jgi:hypothetical protein
MPLFRLPGCASGIHARTPQDYIGLRVKLQISREEYLRSANDLVEQPARVWVDRLGDRILVLAAERGAIALSPAAAAEIGRQLLNEAALQSSEEAA